MSTWLRSRGGSGGARLLGRLGAWIVRHPWYPILFWVILLVVTIPFLSLLGSVTTNSITTLPSNAPSAVASDELARLFPNGTSGSSTVLLFYGPNLTDANGQRVVMNVTTALENDRALTDVASISSVYTTYTAYLAGQVELAGGILLPTLGAVNETSDLLWGPPALYTGIWSSLVANHTSPASANEIAFQQTNSSLHNATASYVLGAFYEVFNTTGNCAANPPEVVACATGAARAGEGPLIRILFPADGQPIANATLAGLGVANSTDWPAVQTVAVELTATTAGLPAPFVLQISNEFPNARIDSAAAGLWATSAVARATLAAEPLAVPYSISSLYVAPGGTASVIDVAFTVSDDYTNSTGGSPVYSDVTTIDSLVPPIVRSTDTTLTIRYVQTGTAPLDLLTNTSVNESIALVLPLTVGLLLAIAMLYFRSPITPLVTFAGLGIALILGLGGTVLIGTLVGHVDTTSITLEEVFVLGVGTDYSIFLASRYREELVHGKSPDEAIVDSMSWAGQSVATSGSTAIIATLALALSGVALLSEWGRVLSIAILITVLLSLTMIPAFLKLIGPRIFWPMSGERFSRHAIRARERLKAETTYFFRAGRATERHPYAIVSVAILASIPLVAIALTAPLSYDFYGQLPTGHTATDGLSELNSHFGDGYAVPSFALVTFRSPLLVNNSTNTMEFADLAALTSLANGTSGIASVATLIGPYGAPLGVWLNLSSQPVGVRADLLGTAQGFVGSDGRTVLLDLVTTSTGLSANAVDAIHSVESSFGHFASSHPEVTATAFGGGAPVISDLAGQSNAATQVLIVAVTVGLIVVLLAVLRSWIIAVLAVATIGLSITWAWALTYLVFQGILGFPLFFYVRTLLIMLVLGLGIDYTIFLLTRVREERLRGRTAEQSAVEAVARTGGIITAAALILACAFGALLVGSFTLIRAIGFSVAVAVILDAMVVRTYLVPASLRLLGERAWSALGRRPRSATETQPPG
ncbi:MAG TPA: MMPL family transporter [Thermoplasmata archaeon]|nr:MMPL family transporter [Thermoplasmata archaeon]